MPKVPPEEYRTRHKRCTEAMQQQGIDCLVLLPGSNFTYFTGLKFMRERYRLLAALITREGKLIVMGPTFEEAKMCSGPLEAQVHTWTDEENQYHHLAGMLKKECGTEARLGLELTSNYYHYLQLREELPDSEFIDPTPATSRIRAIKSKAEIECLREAAARTRARMEKVPSQLARGMTELELARAFGPGAMVQFGLTTSMPNEVAGTRKLQKGDPVVIDAGDRIEGYRSDLTRTFFFGESSEKMREVYRVVNEAELAAIEAAKPGAPAEVIDLAAREVIEKAGYGEFFTHRGGHGLGLDFHELPICVKGNREPLEPGMVLTAEPGVYLPGEFGVRIEDDILITETGHELLSQRGPLQAG